MMDKIQKGERLEYSKKPYGKTLYGVVLSVHKTYIVFKFDNILQSQQFVSLECFNKLDKE
jgi:hypothetical protein